MVKNNIMRKYFINAGVNFNDDTRQFNVGELFNIYYGRPTDSTIEDLSAWQFQLARFYLDLTGLKRHVAKGYQISVVYDAQDVEQIPGTESYERLVNPIVSDITYDGEIEKLEEIRKGVMRILVDLRNNPKLKTKDDAKTAIANKCLYHNDIIPQDYKTPATLSGRGKSRDGAMYDFDLMRAEKPGEGSTPANAKNNIIGEIGRLLHLLVHELAHYNRGELTGNYLGNPASQADYIYYEYLGLRPGQRLYYNPNDVKELRGQATSKAIRIAGGSTNWNRLSTEEREQRIQSEIRRGKLRSGLATAYTEKGRYYRETQAEVISAMVMKALKIPTTMIGGNLALLSNIDGAKDLDNTPSHEVQFYIDTTNAILKKLHSKMDGLDEHHKSLKRMIEQILNNKDLLM